MDQFGNVLNASMQLLLEGFVTLGMGVFLLMVQSMMTLLLIVGFAILMLLARFL